MREKENAKLSFQKLFNNSLRMTKKFLFKSQLLSVLECVCVFKENVLCCLPESVMFIFVVLPPRISYPPHRQSVWPGPTEPR